MRRVRWSIVVFALCPGCERADVRFPQFVQDQLVVLTIASQLAVLVDDELTTRPVGAVSFSAVCEGGGAVHADGAQRPDGTTDLNLDLDGCTIDRLQADGAAATLTLEGAATFTDHIDPTTGFLREELHADELDIRGVVTDENEDREVNDVCALSVIGVGSDVSIAILGRICGRDTTVSIAQPSVCLAPQ